MSNNIQVEGLQFDSESENPDDQLEAKMEIKKRMLQTNALLVSENRSRESSYDRSTSIGEPHSKDNNRVVEVDENF